MVGLVGLYMVGTFVVPKFGGHLPSNGLNQLPQRRFEVGCHGGGRLMLNQRISPNDWQPEGRRIRPFVSRDREHFPVLGRPDASV